MLQYLITKLKYASLTLLGVVTVVFFLFNVLPGDPAQMMLGQNETQAQRDVINAKYGFDKPLYQQYLLYVNDLSPISVHSNDPSDYSYDDGKYSGITVSMGSMSLMLKLPYLRESFQRQGKSVSSVIWSTLPNTILLAVAAISIALILGVVLGIVSALRPDTWVDRTIQLLSTLGMSVPSFFSAILFAFVFAYLLHYVTGLDMTGSLYVMDDYGNAPHVQWRNLILPAVVLGIRPLAVISQLMRNSLLEVMTQEYIRTAYAKGLKTSQVVLKHALRNALNPVITAISGWFASMLAGAVFVEYIFNWNGLGKEIVDALNLLDLPVIMGAVLVIATMFIIINILVDLSYAILDPRVNLE